MDGALELLDPLVLDKAYAWALPYPGVSLSNSSYSKSTSLWPRDNIYRQVISILVITQLGATSLYLMFSALSYYFIFDSRLEYHPRFLQNQIRQEIKSSLSAIPAITILTLPLFLAEVRGKSLLYSKHHPSVYKYIHKSHHKWIFPTPWAALAFHPLDGYVQSLPYQSVSVVICPTQRYLYLLLFIAVQIWTILIQDSDTTTGHWTEKFINSPAHHTLNHMHFTVNYGYYSTSADNCFGSLRRPEPVLDLLHDTLKVIRAKGIIDEQGNPSKAPKRD